MAIQLTELIDALIKTYEESEDGDIPCYIKVDGEIKELKRVFINSVDELIFTPDIGGG